MLSYSLVYALRKPYTAVTFDELEVFGMDYKVAVTIVQIVGYAASKFMGIKLISELRREDRFRFILYSVVMAELSLIFFGLLSAPYNIAAMFLNGLSWDACGESSLVSWKGEKRRISWRAYWA